MKTVIVSLILLTFLPCIQAKPKCSFQNGSVRVDTICNYVVYRTAVDIQLPKNLNFASDEKAFVIIRADKFRRKKIVNWSIELFRVYKKDSIVINYSSSDGGDSPLRIREYNQLMEKFVKSVKIERIHVRKGQECLGVDLLVRFLNSR